MPQKREHIDLPRIPSSPSGRVPQWVLDEALGNKVEPVPWRAPAAPIERVLSAAARR